jgi:hypothetical protein
MAPALFVLFRTNQYGIIDERRIPTSEGRIDRPHPTIDI